MDPVDQIQLESLARVERAFRPGTPIKTQELFAGRTQQLKDAISGVFEAGTHILVYGERGVGKTSLLEVTSEVVSIIANNAQRPIHIVREICSAGDSYDSIWRRAFAKCPVLLSRKQMGFGASTFNADLMTADGLISSDRLLDPGVVNAVMASAKIDLVFIFDEFDRVNDKDVSVPMADTIKATSDYGLRVTIILAGVGDDITELVSAHASIERSTKQILMPRMEFDELREIIDKGQEVAGIIFDDAARDLIVVMARGFPHYVHSLGQAAARSAVLRGGARVTEDHITVALQDAMSRAGRSLGDAYLKATQSPRKDALYRHVLLACALAPTDEQGYFRPSDIQVPLGQILHRDQIRFGTYMNHLTEFASTKRGHILKRTGESRAYRYRFGNALHIPYIFLASMRDGLTDGKELRRIAGLT